MTNYRQARSAQKQRLGIVSSEGEVNTNGLKDDGGKEAIIGTTSGKKLSSTKSLLQHIGNQVGKRK